MSINIPTDYKSLRSYFDYRQYRSKVTFFTPLSTFAGNLFEPFVHKDGRLYVMECPNCGAPGCAVHDNCYDDQDFFLTCDNCLFVNLSPEDVAACSIEVDELIAAIAQAHGCVGERKGNIWDFGKVLIASRYRSLYFTPHPRQEEIQQLLVTTGAILLCFDVEEEDKHRYPHQIFTMAELQQDPKSLVVNLQMIADEVVNKPKVKKSAQKDKRAIQEKKLITLLDQEIRHYQQCLLPGNKPLLNVYETPTYRSLAEKMTLEGIKANYMTISRLLKEGESLELKILYTILQNPEQVKLYKGLAHARTVLSVNR